MNKLIIEDYCAFNSADPSKQSFMSLTGFNDNSCEILGTENNVWLRNKLENHRNKFSSILSQYLRDEMVVSCKFQGHDYLGSPIVTTLQKLLICHEGTIDKTIDYRGSSTAVNYLLNNKQKNFFPIKRCMLIAVIFFKKIIAIGFKFFLNFSGKRQVNTYTTLIYTIPISLKKQDERLNCRYWGDQFSELLNHERTCLMMRSGRGWYEPEARFIHEYDLLPFYVFPTFCWLCLRDLWRRSKALAKVSKLEEKGGTEPNGEQMCRWYWIDSAVDDLVEDTLTHVLYSFIGKRMGRALTSHARVFLLSENQAWERSFQVGLSRVGFEGTVVNFYHGGIKPNEARYDSHKIMLGSVIKKHKNVFCAASPAFVKDEDQIDFLVPNWKLKKTVSSFSRCTFSSASGASVLIFGDFNLSITVEMIGVVLKYLDKFTADKSVLVKWHPAWSRSKIRLCKGKLLGARVVDFGDGTDFAVNWAVSSCFSTAALDGFRLGFKNCLFTRAEWLNLTPIPTGFFERIITAGRLIECPESPDQIDAGDMLAGRFALEEVSWEHVIDRVK